MDIMGKRSVIALKKTEINPWSISSQQQCIAKQVLPTYKLAYVISKRSKTCAFSKLKFVSVK